MDPPTLTSPSRNKASHQFSFAVIGDTPYTKGDKKRFPGLIQSMNRLKPSLLFHVGDMKKGSQSCKKDVFERVKSELDQFSGPVVYTPGDNDWVDCNKKKTNYKDRTKRLKLIRNLFFKRNTPSTLGSTPLKVLSQGKDDRNFQPYVENLAFVMKDVLFLTVHVVGSETDLKNMKKKTRHEHKDRMKANKAWIKAGVTYAKTHSCRAIVLVTHANLRHEKNKEKRNGFKHIHSAIGKTASSFPNPILLIHGDKHQLVIDHPPIWPKFKKGAPHLTRLQVMGGDNTLEGVVVHVTGRNTTKFSFTRVQTT